MAAAKIHDAVVSDDLNYEIWAPIAKTTLTEKGLWDVVENGVPPNPSKIPELAASIQAEEFSKWRDLAVKDMKALQILQSSLTDSAFRKTLSATSAKDLWDSLEKGNNEQAKVRRLEKQFEELSMNEGEPIIPYLDRVIEIVEQLRRFQIAKSDYQVIEKVLATLSGSYDGVAPVLGDLIDLKNTSLKSFVELFYTYDSITDESIHLMLKANRLRSMCEESCGLCNKNNHNQEDCSSSIPRAGKSSGARQSKPKKGKCFQCGERGHKAKDCNKKIQQPAVTTDAQIEIVEKAEIEVDYLLLAALNLNDFTYDENMWMIYGHATNHMTPHEKLFTFLDRTYKAKVGLVDGTVIMVEGRGDVKIKMKEGKQKTINNVIFVPGLNRNVLSVQQMKSRGCSFISGARGECIVHDRTGKEFG
ncbi:unnamed protein product, partial [Arabidopsis halleri]